MYLKTRSCVFNGFCNLRGKRHNGYTLLEVESSKGLRCEAVVEITRFQVESSNSWSRRRQSIMAHVCVCVRVLQEMGK